MPELNPEQEARKQIDAQLMACGWEVQDYKQYNPAASRGIALREVPLKSGTCDYLLLVDRKAVGVIEAKKVGTLLSGVAEQSGHYAANLPDLIQAAVEGPLPFLYESTGVETYFRDERDPAPRSRRVFAFHRPETLAEWIAEPNTLRGRLQHLPPLEPRNLRACQLEGIRNLEESFALAHPRALIQMATGAGKTYTACSFAYRLIKHAGARRILFLVDRANLGRQAMKEFQQFVAPDTGRKFTEVYNVQHLTSNQLDSVARVTICTIQRLYSILRGEELDEDLDEKSGYELAAADDREREVAYNPRVPVETFDFIVTDECHRSIYGLWRQVLEYFDAFTVGLTATPSKQTIGFFNQNLVMEYNHERAVADGVNVGYEVYRIKTAVTEAGGKVEKGFYVDRRHKETRQVRWTRLDEDLVYGAKDLDRSVVVKSQIRTVLTAFKDALFTDLFPGRTLVPKTLIFCKDDSHAEDVVQLVREVFGKGNDFAKKITYKTYDPETKRYEKSDTLIQEFRTSPQLRIAVTVDMIATGTDIKPLECLLFLRDVRSRTYFEQMKGRGTRVLTPTDLQAVSGADARAKTHFIIVDAVGVCESDKTDSRPLERKRNVAFDKLLLGVALGKRDEDSLTTLAGRIARLGRELSHGDTEALREIAGGKSLSDLANALLKAVNPDAIAERAAGKHGVEPEKIAPEALEKARKELISEACAPFDSPVLRDALAKAKQEAEQIIDGVTIDQTTYRGFDTAAKEKAQSLLSSFRAYIEQHKAEIDALQILYSRPYKQRLTEPMLKELEKKLRENHAAWTEDRLWDACAVAAPGKVKGRSQPGRFADLVSLVRFSLEQQPVLKPFAESVNERFNEWLTDKAKAGTTFTHEQLAWLKLIRDHIATSLSIETDDLELSPFNQQGGLGKAHQLFGDQLPKLLDELNTVLSA
ncbi:MAG TPA: type I restriction-modification enzyme R subunit C-terminal domain-containing protein [Kiritimatiellia bacterium]|nr:type I restriction-modification enzyme R subunit C-terminal domain-containing protein [Kiritimatiellia bacterium]